MNNLTIRGGRVIDPANNVDAVRDVFVRDGKIAAEPLADAPVVDAAGLVVTPGLIDLHVHLREPGRSDKETIETGTRCAAFGARCAGPEQGVIATHGEDWLRPFADGGAP